jgi:rod shape-determining protein MreC|tara:strand:- start:272 stop:1099 length:828 start_codon:yes stop_codon:yes gene_type:complete
VRNLINLLVKNHRLAIFVLLEIIALIWLVSSHAMHKNRMASMGLEISDSWVYALGRLESFNTLDSTNSALNDELSKLRSENIILLENAGIDCIEDFEYESPHDGWYTIPAEVIYSTTHKKNNLIVANKGLVDGINIGAGMLDKGFLAGRVVEITNDKALVFPITHKKPSWSVRINSDGTEGVMTWDGDDLTQGTVRDVFKAALILPGNSVITTGFQGVFPPGIEIGTVLKVESNDDDNFQTVYIELGADFYSIRYVEFIQNRDNLSIDSLINSIE